MIISILIPLVSLLCPFLIFLDYHKRSNIHLAISYVIVFFGLVFLLSKVIYYYGMFLALSAPILILIMCIIKKKH
ncbi:MAG: hypothetical protein K0S23_3327 [Fluviicola sp.]|jgi:hypothetical protein|nr:hypothetical protein [Fluviicola sp.]